MASRSSSYGSARTKARIQGVGADKRRQGYAWGSLSPAQRAHFGSQKNFRAAAEDAADRQNAEAEAARQEAVRERGRQEVMDAQPAPPQVSPSAQAPSPSPAPQAQTQAPATTEAPPKVDPYRFDPQRDLTRELAERAKREETARDTARARARSSKRQRRATSPRFDGMTMTQFRQQHR